MTISYATAVARFVAGYWNAESKTDANPGGMGANGHTVNLPAVAEAIGVVATQIASQAGTASTDAGTATGAAAAAVAARDTTLAARDVAVDAAEAAAQSALDAAGAVGGFKVSGDDTVPGDLETKLTAGSGVSFSTTSPGGDERRVITATPAGAASADVSMGSYLLTVSRVEASGFNDLGNVTGTATVTSVYASSLRLTGDTTVTLTEPTAGTEATHRLTVINSGGYVPTFTGFDWAPDDEPDWAAQATDEATIVGWGVTADGYKIIYVMWEDA